MLPRIVKTLQGALSAGGRVYVHCTAGLGRAPAACIAWRYWFNGKQLDEVRRALAPSKLPFFGPPKHCHRLTRPPDAPAEGLW
jgi:protein-tyrosine phosphatase